MKIVLLESLGISESSLQRHIAPLTEAGHEFKAYPKNTDPAVQIEEAKDADIIMIANMPLRAEVINSCSKLKYIDVAFTGVDHVDLEAARAKGIQVSNAAGYSTQSVAELVLCMMISLLRNVRHVTGNEPSFIHFVTLDELLEQSDIVSLHCPLTPETHHLINAERISKMKQGAYLINTARGGVIDSEALAQALNEGYLSGAGIDVFENEPPLDTNHPLLHTKNTIVTPHIAFASAESMEARAEIVFQNIKTWLEGKQQNIIL